MKRTNPVNSGASSLRNASQPGRFLSLRMKTPPLITESRPPRREDNPRRHRVPYLQHMIAPIALLNVNGQKQLSFQGHFKVSGILVEICGKPAPIQRFLTIPL
jgi:hypothetical protein